MIFHVMIPQAAYGHLRFIPSYTHKIFLSFPFRTLVHVNQGKCTFDKVK